MNQCFSPHWHRKTRSFLLVLMVRLRSFLLERLAQTLRLEYRFYNASLINYDDQSDPHA